MWAAGLPFLLIALPLLVGVALIATGLRGRRVGEHPHCRVCGFDLIGLPKDAQRCSECGADVTKPRAIVIGQRVRFRGRIAFGLVLLLLLSTGVVFGLRQANLNPYKPTWWLKIEAQYASDATADAALVEIVTRVRAKQIGDGTLASLIDIALARQTGPAKKWRGGWADVVEAARASGKISDERWLQYARSAIEGAVTFEIRKRVTRGDVIPWQIRFGGPGWRGSNAIGGRLRTTLTAVTFDGELFHTAGSQQFGLTFNGGSGMSSTGAYVRPSGNDLAAARDGIHEVKGVADIIVSEVGGAGRLIHHPIASKYTLLPEDESSVVAHNDPLLAGAIHESLTVPQARLQRHGEQTWMQLSITGQSLPVPLSMEVVVRVRGSNETLSLRWLTMPKSTTATGSHTHTLGALASPEFLAALHAARNRIDVSLHPHRAAAAATVDIDEYWVGDRPIVIENVQVADPPSGAKVDAPMSIGTQPGRTR